MPRTRKEILGLPEDASDEQVAEADRKMAAEIIAGTDTHAALREQEEEARIRTRGQIDGQFSGRIKIQGGIKEIKLKEAMVREYDNYPYLLGEDARFAKAFRLSEDEALKLFGGLKNYTQHRLDRSKARSEGHDVQALSDSLESHMDALRLTDITEKQLAAQLASDQVAKVKGITAGIKAGEAITKQADREKRGQAIVKESRLKELCEEAGARFGWEAASQSAKDWAEKEYKKRWGGTYGA